MSDPAENLASIGANLSANADGTFTALASPSQFDVTKKLATTEFVQRALGNTRGVNSYSAAQVLTVADVGFTIILGGTSYTVTLPLASACLVGSTIKLRNRGTGDITIAAQGTDGVNITGADVATVKISPGDTMVIEKTAVSQWSIVGGEGTLPQSSMFAFLASANGYQKFPTGLMIQWGAVTTVAGTATVVFPKAFEVACYSVTTTPEGGNFTSFVGSISKTGVSIGTQIGNTGANAATTVHYIAIGK